MAKRLYISQDDAKNMLKDFRDSGVCVAAEQADECFIFSPPPELNRLIADLADFYANNLIEVTNMIHSRGQSGRRVQLFADAFKFNKEN